jgi:hypothetical protein
VFGEHLEDALIARHLIEGHLGECRLHRDADLFEELGLMDHRGVQGEQLAFRVADVLETVGDIAGHMHRRSHRRLDGVLVAVLVLAVDLVFAFEYPEGLLGHVSVQEFGSASGQADDLGEEVGVVRVLTGDLERHHVAQHEHRLALVGPQRDDLLVAVQGLPPCPALLVKG